MGIANDHRRQPNLHFADEDNKATISEVRSQQRNGLMRGLRTALL
jgi:hypothetical protein